MLRVCIGCLSMMFIILFWRSKEMTRTSRTPTKRPRGVRDRANHTIHPQNGQSQQQTTTTPDATLVANKRRAANRALPTPQGNLGPRVASAPGEVRNRFPTFLVVGALFTIAYYSQLPFANDTWWMAFSSWQIIARAFSDLPSTIPRFAAMLA